MLGHLVRFTASVILVIVVNKAELLCPLLLKLSLETMLDTYTLTYVHRRRPPFAVVGKNWCHADLSRTIIRQMTLICVLFLSQDVSR